jgi:hypothetical protein
MLAIVAAVVVAALAVVVLIVLLRWPRPEPSMTDHEDEPPEDVPPIVDII